MITKFSPGDIVNAWVDIQLGHKVRVEGTIRLLAAKSNTNIQYEIELHKPVNGNEFLWFYENELSLVKRHFPNSGSAA